MSRYDILGKIKEYFSSIDVVFPTTPQPINVWRSLGMSDETTAKLQAEYRRIRHGPELTSMVKLTGVTRIMEYIGHDPTRVIPPEGYHLRGEAVVVHPKLGVYELPISLKTGEQWSQSRQDRLLASRLKEEQPNLSNTSSAIKASTVKVNWYLTTYTR